APRDEIHITYGLRRQVRLAIEPSMHSLGAGVIGRGGKADIAELVSEIGEQTCGMDDGGLRLEGIVETTIRGGAWHKLRDTLRPLGTDRVRIEAALLPDQPNEQHRRQTHLV